MKNFTFSLIFILSAVLGFSQACPDPTSVICDDLDAYTVGDVIGQAGADHWVAWPGSSLSGQVIDTNSFSGSQSLYIGAGPVLDMLFLTGDQTSGLTTLAWKMYVPANATAYFNVQANPSAGDSYVYQLYFNEGGANPGLATFQQLPPEFDYPQDEWFDVSLSVNMNSLTHSLSVNGNDILVGTDYVANAGSQPATHFSSINFYAVDAANQYYIDDIVMHYDPLTSLDELDQDKFSIYPNPTTDVLNIATEKNIESIVMNDLLGHVVIAENNINNMPTQLDISALSQGIYMISLQIDGETFTQKVIKR
ncbi:MAG: T9SS type A sorting domain-containing protein [Flavobacteriales bacterium]|nr:T9SS type A sorting domain-containing protein [Flavobacteriales bacterium]